MGFLSIIRLFLIEIFTRKLLVPIQGSARPLLRSIPEFSLMPFSTAEFRAGRRCWAFCFILSVLCWRSVFAQQAGDAQPDRILDQLKQRIREQPGDGATWRLLGRALILQGKLDEAEPALERAVALRPHSAAAWFDLGRVKKAQTRNAAAREAFETVLALAPDSDYAKSAQTELQALEPPTDGQVVQAGYEVRQFDGEEFLNRLEDTDPPQRNWLANNMDLRVETGLLYNSNVALAPISRQLAPGNRASAQLFVSPDLQMTLHDARTWRTGPTLRGHFTLNQPDFQNFDLQSYRPGWFAEWFWFSENRIVVPRLDYEFTHDEFAGNTLGNRHSLLASLGTFWNDQQATFLYYSLQRTNFLNDGLLPSVTSQDGWSHTLGLSHDVAMPYRHLRLLRAGVDVNRIITRGTDYRFNGVNLFGEGVIPIVPTIELTARAGWGYRNYFDYEFTPSRNENLWNAGLEARKYFSSHLSTALVFNYNKFDSQNPLFAAQRYITGVVLEWEY